MPERKKNYLITSPIYYPTDIPHLSAAYSVVFADTCARYHRMFEDEVHFITGSDEHGQKVQQAARAHRKTPLEFADRMTSGIVTVWKKLQISYTDFIRTTEERHVNVVEEVFRYLQAKGDIYMGEYDGWYCIACESFWSNTMVENHKCPRNECKQPLEQLREQGYFFKLSKYASQILDYIEKHPDFIKPTASRNETIMALKNGIQDICITRRGPVWGIPVPTDPDFIIYVWFDALLNYISSVGYNTEEFKKLWPPDVQVVGRDMLKFHSIIWPGICFALEIEPPQTIFVQGWVLSGGKRISRSLSGSANLVEIIDEFGPDALRYYMLREVSAGNDLEFSIPRLVERLNNELANDLGNLLSRSISMIIKYCEGKIPQPGRKTTGERNLERIFKGVKNEYKKSMDRMEFREALQSLWDLVGALNKYIVDCSPWDLHKFGDTERLHTSLYTLMDYLRIITVMVTPFIPRAAIKMWRRLGFKDVLWKVKFNAINPDLIPVGQEVKMLSPLFPRMEMVG